MRYALLADVHANIEALRAVLAAVDASGVDRVLGLGDLVGYHANPNECIELMRARGVVCVAGNHDRAAVGLLDTGEFGETGHRAILWTRRVLTRENADWLASLPATREIDGEILLFHAALHPEPNYMRYLSSAVPARQSLEVMRRRFGARLAAFGHTHRHVVHSLADDGGFESKKGPWARLDEIARHLLNPGSVGQPRDGDPRAAFAVLDTALREIRFERVPYDALRTREKAAQAGLLFEPPVYRRAFREVTDWLETGVSAVMRRLP